MTKFEQLLDYIVNEEHEKANELFHEIVVEKSREIYENLIAEEEQEDDEDDESADDNVDESADEDMEESDYEDMEESDDMDLEDSYMMDGDDEDDSMSEPSGLEKTDDLESDIESSDEEVEFSVRDAIEKLQDALAALGAEPEGSSDMGDDMGDMGDDMPKEDDMMGVPAFEGRRMTREYREKVGNDWEKNSQKTQGQHAGAGTGDKDTNATDGKSVVASGANKPGPAGVNGKNLHQSYVEPQHNTGTSPNKVNNGVTPSSGEKYSKGEVNVDGKQSGVKSLSKVSQNSKSAGPVGSGSGDKAGQTSIGNQKSLLKGFTK